jgi:predicted esterase
MRGTVAASISLATLAALAACRDAGAPGAGRRGRSDARVDLGADAAAVASAGDAGGAGGAGDAGDDAGDAVRTATARGPFEIPFLGARKVYYVRAAREGRARLLANLHGVCNPPGYACGYWVSAASDAGTLVCPEGNDRCGGPGGPVTWKEPFTAIDDDLERAIATVSAAHPGEIDRAGAILTGFSLGAHAAADVARRHPGRWPHLILTEADVPLDAATLRKAGVRAVALLAGERGSQLAGARRTAERLAKGGYPAKLIVMRGAGHHYSADIDALMADAIAFVTSAPELATVDAGAR